MKLKHLHPVTTWNYLSRFSFFLIIPVIQILLSRPKGWILFSSLITLLFLILLAVFQYLANRYSIDEHESIYKSGILIKKNRFIPSQRFLSAIVQITPSLSIFGAARLYLDTPAGNRKTQI